MARLNRKAVRSYEGGGLLRVPPEVALFKLVGARLLFEPTYYEAPGHGALRISELAKLVHPRYLAMLMLCARKVFRLRSTPVYLTACAMDAVRGTAYAKLIEDVAVEVLDRPDFLSELVAIHWRDAKRPLPAVMKRALRRAFLRFDAYQLRKWGRRRNARVRLRDVMFLVHPTPPPGMEDVYRELANDRLRPAETWESAAAGSASREERRQRFEALMRERKLPALACLMGLRMFADLGVDRELLLDYVSSLDVRKLLPSKLYAAWLVAKRDLGDEELAAILNVKWADTALSLPPLPDRPRVAAVVDVSASMAWGGTVPPMDLGAMAALLARMRWGADIWVFSNDVARVDLPADGLTLADVERVTHAVRNAGTMLGYAIDTVSDRDYDLILVFTDQQLHDRVRRLHDGQRGIVFVMVGYGRGSAVELGRQWEMIPGLSEKALIYTAYARFAERYSPERVVATMLAVGERNGWLSIPERLKAELEPLPELEPQLESIGAW